MPNLITTCCPKVNLLVEKYFPDLLDQLAPVPSPAVAHARMLRQAHGDDIRVVFVGPCISKKNEAQQSGVIDAVLMYDELREFLRGRPRHEGALYVLPDEQGRGVHLLPEG